MNNFPAHRFSSDYTENLEALIAEVGVGLIVDHITEFLSIGASKDVGLKSDFIDSIHRDKKLRKIDNLMGKIGGYLLLAYCYSKRDDNQKSYEYYQKFRSVFVGNSSVSPDWHQSSFRTFEMGVFHSALGEAIMEDRIDIEYLNLVEDFNIYGRIKSIVEFSVNFSELSERLFGRDFSDTQIFHTNSRVFDIFIAQTMTNENLAPESISGMLFQFKDAVAKIEEEIPGGLKITALRIHHPKMFVIPMLILDNLIPGIKTEMGEVVEYPF